MRMPSQPARAVALLAAALGCQAHSAFGQALAVPFPASPSGYDQELGVTVQTRLRPVLNQSGIQVGTFSVRPTADETLSYNSNPTGTSSQGSPVFHTAVNVAAASLWSRNALQVSAGADEYNYLSIPGLDFTDWHLGLGGGYTIANNLLSAAYYHQSYHPVRNGDRHHAVRHAGGRSDRHGAARLYLHVVSPVAYPRAGGERLSVRPATVGNTTVDQSFLNRDVVTAGLSALYALSDVGNIVVTARGVQSTFVNKQPGQPSNSSTSAIVLAGLDYQPEGPWRFRLLGGFESRSFAASVYGSRTTPINRRRGDVDADRVLTVEADLSRRIDDPEAGGTIGFVLTQFALRTDFELRRDVILHAQGSVELAEFISQGNQTSLTGGVGADWFINRHLRVSLNGQYTTQSSVSGSAAPTPTAFYAHGDRGRPQRRVQPGYRRPVSAFQSVRRRTRRIAARPKLRPGEARWCLGARCSSASVGTRRSRLAC